MKIQGGASDKGTKSYFQKHSLSVAPVTLGRTGWTVSPVGFGGYRVQDSNSVHRESLQLALRSGCNLIDTSTNYGDGGSEALVGQVLKDLIASGEIKREQVVVVTKAGYVQGSNLDLARKRASQGQPFPEMVEFQDGCWHCISPEFLADQLDRSLERLGLEKVDVLLLHNPEYFLKTEGDHREYYRRIRTAFEYLETEVARGRIQYYGISSNTFPDPKESSEYTSLETVIESAQEVSAKNHFAVIQFPFNLYEPGAALEPNNSGKSVTELAHQENLGTLVNRPLNSFYGDELVRLASFPVVDADRSRDRIKSALTGAMGLESHYPGKAVVPPAQIAWGHILRENFERLSRIDFWNDVLSYQIRPTLDGALAKLEENAEFRTWASDYRKASDELFAAFTEFLQSQYGGASLRRARALDEACPELKSSATLSQKAIRIYRSIPGIHCILVGMRRPEYVRDTLTLAPPVSADLAVRAMERLGQSEI